MQLQVHPLEPFFRQAVRISFEETLGLNDAEMTAYVAQMLCGFTQAGDLYKMRDERNRPIEDLEGMLKAADPVFGTASSFDAERAARKAIGDYTLFVAGMYPEATLTGPHFHPSVGELIQVGKESYSIVSTFNLFEYEEEAPLFVRLAEGFERCVLGLALVRDQLGPSQLLPRPTRVR
jgi:hypothetical protein